MAKNDTLHVHVHLHIEEANNVTSVSLPCFMV